MLQVPESYSTTVEAFLLVGDQRFSVANLGHEQCIVRSPKPMQPSAAELVLRVDGEEQRWSVFLVDGIPATGQVNYRDL